MADVSQLIGQGIGFSPGSVKFIVTDGLGIGATTNITGSYALSGSYIVSAALSGSYTPSVAISGSYITSHSLNGSVS